MKTKVISIFLIVLMAIPNMSYASATMENKQIMKQYVEESGVFKDSIYYTSEIVIGAQLSKEQLQENKARIDQQLNNIARFQKQIEQYNNTLDYGSVDSRNATMLLIVISFYKNAFDELLIYMGSDDQTVRFEALERFYYDMNAAAQKLDWLKRLIN